MIDGRQPWEQEPWEREPWVRDVDALARPALVVEPPPEVQQSILAAVLLAAAPQPIPMPVVVAEPAERQIPLAAYVLLAGVLVAYIAGLSWLQGMFGNTTWLAILGEQLLAVTEQAFGRPSTGEPLALVWQVFVRAPWLALLPVVWLLWERDRASSPVA